MPCPLVKNFPCFKGSSCLHLEATLYLQKFWNSLLIARSITYWKNCIFIDNFSILIYLSTLNFSILIYLSILPGTKDSTSSRVARLLENLGFKSQQKQELYFTLCLDWLWGPPSIQVNGYHGALSQGVKRQEPWGWG